MASATSARVGLALSLFALSAGASGTSRTHPLPGASGEASAASDWAGTSSEGRGEPGPGSDAGMADDGGKGSSDGNSSDSGARDAGATTPQKLILYDDSNGRLLYINGPTPAANWI